MSGDSEAVVLERALRDLREAWAVAGDGWRDGTRAEYERDQLEQIEWRTRHAIRALDELAALCADALRSCE